MLPVLIFALTACSGTSSVVGPDDQKGQPSLTTIRVEPAAVELAVGDTTRLTLEGHDAEGSPVSMGGERVRWTSSDSEVVTVDSTGLVRTLSVGVAHIDVEVVNAESNGTSLKDSAQVRSTRDDHSDDGSGEGGGGDSEGSASPDTVVVSPTSIDLDVSQTAELHASVRDSNGEELSMEVDWRSENPAVATVDSLGRVTGRQAGGTRILAAADPATGAASINVVASKPSHGSEDVFRAFPEAEGYGAQALTSCDRSEIQVLRVTNLLDSGPGSFRSALERVKAGVLSVMIFDVAGYIDLRNPIDTSPNCLYIAGQTAPGGGVTIRNLGTRILVKGNTNDLVIRYLRMRGGYHGDSRGHNNLLIGSGHDMILDHLSFGWTSNYLLGIMKYDANWSRPVARISVQRTLFHEVFAVHPTAIQITAHGVDQLPYISKLDLHHSLLAHNHHRNPANNTRGLKFVNNVTYNWMQGATQAGGAQDVINNYYKKGPMTGAYDWEITWNCSFDRTPSLYLSGNIGPHNRSAGADNWTGDSRMIACYYDTGDFIGQAIPNWEDYRRLDPLPEADIPIQIQSASRAYDSVLQDVGANARLRCDGSWTSNSDAVDQRVIREVRDGTGVGRPPETESDVGGFPAISSGVPCTDDDGDGMPNEFEVRYGLDGSHGADAAADSDGDGYTNLEEYLNGTAPR